MSAEFVDTNVLLYAFSQDEPAKRERVQSLLDRLWQSGEGRLSIRLSTTLRGVSILMG